MKTRKKISMIIKFSTKWLMAMVDGDYQAKIIEQYIATVKKAAHR